MMEAVRVNKTTSKKKGKVMKPSSSYQQESKVVSTHDSSTLAVSDSQYDPLSTTATTSSESLAESSASGVEMSGEIEQCDMVNVTIDLVETSPTFASIDDCSTMNVCSELVNMMSVKEDVIAVVLPATYVVNDTSSTAATVTDYASSTIITSDKNEERNGTEFNGVEIVSTYPAVVDSSTLIASSERVNIAAVSMSPITNEQCELVERNANPVGDMNISSSSYAALYASMESGRIFDLGCSITMMPFTEEELSTYYSNGLIDAGEVNCDLINSFTCRPFHNGRGKGGLAEELHSAITRLRESYIKLSSVLTGVDIIQIDIAELIKKCLRIEKRTKILASYCGDGNRVEHRIEYEYAVFDSAAHARLKSTMTKLREFEYWDVEDILYQCASVRLEIDVLLDNFLSRAALFSFQTSSIGIPNMSTCNNYSGSSELEDCETIRNCLDVLFSFSREEQDIDDSSFSSDLRRWLCNMLSALVSVGTFLDQGYVLNHLVRFRGSGKWGPKFIQFPDVWSQQAADHFILMLALLLQPTIKNSQDFFDPSRSSFTSHQMPEPEQQSHNDCSSEWVLIGQEFEVDPVIISPSPLTEDDITALLEQFPFNSFFHYLLSVGEPFINDVSSTLTLCTQDILRSFVFSLKITRQLIAAINRFPVNSYGRLLRRLGHYIVQLARYLSIWWNVVRQHPSLQNMKVSLSRLQLEFDSFIVRVTRLLYSACLPGRWQCISELPWTCISSHTAWGIFYMLYTSVSGKQFDIVDSPSRWQMYSGDSVSFRESFKEKLMNMGDIDHVFLLTTFANLAIAHPRVADQPNDSVMIISLELFSLGYLDYDTRDTCLKTCLHLIGTIASAHPSIISSILAVISQNASNINASILKLFSLLPLRLWRPDAADMAILRTWTFGSVDNLTWVVAWVILRNLQWGATYPTKLGCTDELVLGSEWHIAASRLALDVFNMHNFKKESTILSSVKNFVSYDPDEMLRWEARIRSWELVLLSDIRRTGEAGAVLVEEFKSTPVGQSVLVLYIWAQVTFSVCNKLELESKMLDLFLSEGMATCHKLLDMYQPISIGVRNVVFLGESIAVLRILHDSIAAFFELFPAKNVLRALNSSPVIDLIDRLISLSVPDAGLKQWVTSIRSAVQSTIQSVTTVDRSVVIELWLRIFIALPEWRGRPHVRMCIDGVIEIAFLMHARSVVRIVLLEAHKKLPRREHRHKGLFKSMFSWVNGIPQFDSLLVCSVDVPTPNSIVLRNLKIRRNDIFEDIDISTPWLAYEILCLETALELGLRLSIGPRLVKNPHVPLTDVIQETSFMPLNHFVIYRWVHVAVHVENSHVLMPLFWQGVFSLYFAACGSGYYGHRFLDMSSHGPLLSEMREKLTRLRESSSMRFGDGSRAIEYDDLGIVDSDNVQEPVSSSRLDPPVYHSSRNSMFASPSAASPDCLKEDHISESRSRLYNAMVLWLGEPRIYSSSFHIETLPSSFELVFLLDVVGRDPYSHGEMIPWLNLIPFTKCLRACVPSPRSYWCSMTDANIKAALNSSVPIGIASNVTICDDDISAENDLNITRLNLSKANMLVVPKPSFSPQQACVQPADIFTMVDETDIVELLKRDFSILETAARSFASRQSRTSMIDSDYVNLLSRRFQNVERLVTLNIPCKQLSKSCGRLALLQARIAEMHENENVTISAIDNRHHRNDISLSLLVAKALSTTSDGVDVNSETDLLRLCKAILRIQNTLQLIFSLAGPLLMGRQHTASNIAKLARSAGLVLLKHLLTMRKEHIELRAFPPTNSAISVIIHSISDYFVTGDPSLMFDHLQLIIAHYKDTPLLISAFQPHILPGSFVDMYTTVSNELAIDHVNLVALIDAFDIRAWLEVEASANNTVFLIEAICKALGKFGVEPAQEWSSVIDAHRRALKVIFETSFPKHISAVLKTVIRASVHHRMPAAVWWDIVNTFADQQKDYISTEDALPSGRLDNLPFPAYSLSMPSIFIGEISYWLSTTFTEERISGKQLYSMWKPYLDMLIFLHHSLMTVVLLDYSKRDGEQLNALWEIHCSLFNPWTAVMPPDVAPPACEQPFCVDHAETATNMLLGMCISVRMISDVSSSVLSIFWKEFLYPSLLTAQSYVLRLLLPHCLPDNSSSLPWVLWSISTGEVEQMFNIIDTKNYGPYDDIKCAILCALLVSSDWKGIIDVNGVDNSVGLSIDTPSLCASSLLTLVAAIVLSPQHVGTEHTLHSLLEKCATVQWTTLTDQEYEDVLSRYADILTSDSASFVSLCSSTESMRGPLSSLAFVFLHATGACSLDATWSSRRCDESVGVRIAKRLRSFAVVACHAMRSASIPDALVVFRTLLRLAAALISVLPPTYLSVGTTLSDIVDDLLNSIVSCILVGNNINDIVNVLAAEIYESNSGSGMAPLLLPLITAVMKVLRTSMGALCVEYIIKLWFMTPSVCLRPDNGWGWDEVAPRLGMNRDITLATFMSETEDFVHSCYVNNCLLALHAHMIRRMQLCCSEGDRKGVCVTVVGWTEKRPPATRDHAQRFEFESKWVLLWSAAIRLLMSYSSDTNSRLQLISLADHLDAIANIREGGFIGLGSRSPFSIPFTLFMRSISAFLYSRFCSPGSVKCKLDILVGFTKNRAFSAHYGALYSAIEIINGSLPDDASVAVCGRLAEVLFPAQPWLFVLRNM